MELHKYFSQKNSKGNCFPIGSSCQPCLVQADFLLVAWNGSMLLFWSRSGKETRSLFTFPVNGRYSSLLFWLALLYFLSPFSLGQFISLPTPFLSFAFLDKSFLRPIALLSPLLTKILQVQLQFYKNVLGQFQILS